MYYTSVWYWVSWRFDRFRKKLLETSARESLRTQWMHRELAALHLIGSSSWFWFVCCERTSHSLHLIAFSMKTFHCKNCLFKRPEWSPCNLFDSKLWTQREGVLREFSTKTGRRISFQSFIRRFSVKFSFLNSKPKQFFDLLCSLEFLEELKSRLSTEWAGPLAYEHKERISLRDVSRASKSNRMHLIIWMFKTANKLIHLFFSTCLHAPLSIVKMLDHLWQTEPYPNPLAHTHKLQHNRRFAVRSAGRRVLHRLHRPERPGCEGLLLSSRRSAVLLRRCTEQVLLQPKRATRTAAESVGTVGPNQRAQH